VEKTNGRTSTTSLKTRARELLSKRLRTDISLSDYEIKRKKRKERHGERAELREEGGTARVGDQHGLSDWAVRVCGKEGGRTSRGCRRLITVYHPESLFMRLKKTAGDLLGWSIGASGSKLGSHPTSPPIPFCSMGGWQKKALEGCLQPKALFLQAVCLGSNHQGGI